MWFFLLCQQRARVFTLISKNGVQNITEDRGWECAGEFWHADNICCWSRTSHDQKDGWWGPTCPHFLNPQQPLFFWALGESGNKLWTQQWRNHLHYWRHPAVTEQHCHLTRLKHVSVTDKALFSLQSSGVIGVTLCKICDGKSLLGLKFIHSGLWKTFCK